MVEIPKYIIPNILASGLRGKKIPLHIALNTGPVKSWALDNKKELSETIKRHVESIDSMLDLQIKNQNRVMTIALSDDSPEVMAALKEHFIKLVNDERIHKNQVRLFVIGQWYELDIELIEAFKEMMERTKQYDNLFLNFCIRYDGQEEITGAIRLMVRKILSGKIKEDGLTAPAIKENIYSSYFPPPELIIEPSCSYSGLLLWDSPGATIYYANKDWMIFDKKDFDDALGFYTKIRRMEN